MDDTPVGALMTEPVLTVDVDDVVGDVGEAMLEQGIKSVVVIDDDCRPEGILTSTDFVEIATGGPGATEATVSEWMTAGVHTVATDEPVAAAIDEMLAAAISHLPVVEGGEVVGILSMTDIVAGMGDTSAAE